MKALFQAIYIVFQGSALDESLDGKLFPDETPQGKRLPYGIYSMTSAVAGYTFTDVHERVLLQFDLYAATDVDADDLYEDLKALFDDCSLSVTGFRFGKMERVSAQRIKDPHYWRWIVEYVITLEKI